MRRAFAEIDVFTAVPYLGSPLAVVLNGEGLSPGWPTAASPKIAEAVAALGISPAAVVDSAWIDNGPGWLGILLATAEEVLSIKPSNTSLKVGVIGPQPAGSSSVYEVRAFFPEGASTIEDPVTGSLNASVAQWLVGSGRFTPPYVATQGTVLGRAGRVYISSDAGGQIWVGGDAVGCVSGFVEL